MSIQRILSEVETYEGVLDLAPGPGSAHPEISWGDHFFYYAPDGQIPRTRQPFATIVTKNYPGDTGSRLDDTDRWRLNIHSGADRFTEDPSVSDVGAVDVFLPHPVYPGWVCVVNPETRSLDTALELLRIAYLADRQRVERRARRSDSASDGSE
ncbi:DUF6194 family protein [Rhodococcoides fascians]|uniref:DUF6194 family protein n=1 Tax=Rhodococcoides fascians TaxID=1828 RepID=UPI00056BB891|nr:MULTISPECIES: DUF6194 family protein [Rhodococcus]OZF05363.1 hypothetical protein CH301_02925 [Rhodococcus sp. 15-1189-1-1a]OZF20149.1 hypothetical protein CH299_03470 [Rhodococcus sp. 14-2686-1-2]